MGQTGTYKGAGKTESALRMQEELDRRVVAGQAEVGAGKGVEAAYEHKVVLLPVDRAAWAQQLDAYGAEGWKTVGFDAHATDRYAVMVRRVGGGGK